MPYKYLLKCSKTLLEQSRSILVKQVGVKEVGENRGVEIKKYLASIGLSEGNPYCAAGQYWCFAEACDQLDIEVSQIPIPKTGLAYSLFLHAQKYGKIVDYIPQIDDLIIWKNKKNHHGHVERIVDVYPDSKNVMTIGFNTGDMGDEEGVHMKRRNIYDPLNGKIVVGLIGFIQ